MSKEDYESFGFPKSEIEARLAEYNEKMSGGFVTSGYLNGKVDGIYEALEILKDFIDESINNSHAIRYVKQAAKKIIEGGELSEDVMKLINDDVKNIIKLVYKENEL